MKYERVSKRVMAGVKPIVIHVECEAKCNDFFKRCEFCDLEKDLLNRLADLEDKIENGTLVEVRHGEWVVDAYNGDEIVRIPYAVHEHNEPYCSLCGSYALLDGKEDYVPSNFCPRCGAKMDGEGKS